MRQVARGLGWAGLGGETIGSRGHTVVGGMLVIRGEIFFNFCSQLLNRQSNSNGLTSAMIDSGVTVACGLLAVLAGLSLFVALWGGG